MQGGQRVGSGIDPGIGPFIKQGGYVLDVQNAQWYRIQDVEPATGCYDRFLSIERVAQVGAGEDFNLNCQLDPSEDVNNNGILDPGEDTNGNGLLDPAEDINNNNAIDFGQAIFMRGIVEVYPIGSK